MAVIVKYGKGANLDEHVALFGPDVVKCSVCGEPYAAAFWRGAEIVKVCRTCALDVLPALIADALLGPYGTGPCSIANLYRDTDRMGARFWRAAAVAIHRTVRRERGDEQEPVPEWQADNIAPRPATNGKANGRAAR